MPQDSPLSTTASAIGILTFLVAVAAGMYARAIDMRSLAAMDSDVGAKKAAVVRLLRDAGGMERNVARFDDGFVAPIGEMEGEVVVVVVGEKGRSGREVNLEREIQGLFEACLEVGFQLVWVGAEMGKAGRRRRWKERREGVARGVEAAEGVRGRVAELVYMKQFDRLHKRLDTISLQITALTHRENGNGPRDSRTNSITTPTKPTCTSCTEKAPNNHDEPTSPPHPISPNANTITKTSPPTKSPYTPPAETSLFQRALTSFLQEQHELRRQGRNRHHGDSDGRDVLGLFEGLKGSEGLVELLL